MSIPRIGFDPDLGRPAIPSRADLEQQRHTQELASGRKTEELIFSVSIANRFSSELEALKEKGKELLFSRRKGGESWDVAKKRLDSYIDLCTRAETAWESVNTCASANARLPREKTELSTTSQNIAETALQEKAKISNYKKIFEDLKKEIEDRKDKDAAAEAKHRTKETQLEEEFLETYNPERKEKKRKEFYEFKASYEPPSLSLSTKKLPSLTKIDLFRVMDHFYEERDTPPSVASTQTKAPRALFDNHTELENAYKEAKEYINNLDTILDPLREPHLCNSSTAEDEIKREITKVLCLINNLNIQTNRAIELWKERIETLPEDHILKEKEKKQYTAEADCQILQYQRWIEKATKALTEKADAAFAKAKEPKPLPGPLEGPLTREEQELEDAYQRELAAYNARVEEILATPTRPQEAPPPRPVPPLPSKKELVAAFAKAYEEFNQLAKRLEGVCISTEYGAMLQQNHLSAWFDSRKFCAALIEMETKADLQMHYRVVLDYLNSVDPTRSHEVPEAPQPPKSGLWSRLTGGGGGSSTVV